MATLMFMIANEPHPDILGKRPELASKAPDVSKILDKILQKEPGALSEWWGIRN